MSKRSHKAVGIKVFLTILALWQKDPDPGPDHDPDPYLWLMNPDPGGPKHVDPVDPDTYSGPDPQHWL
jgi:hypothetical protein